MIHGHTTLFETINFILLIALLVYFLRKPLARFFRERSRAIDEALEAGRKALESAQAQLASAEEKLRNLESETRALKEAAAQETEMERERLRQAAEKETEKILESARGVIHSATQAAKLDLKRFAARQASELAEKMIRERMDDPARSRLVTRFMENIPSSSDDTKQGM